MHIGLTYDLRAAYLAEGYTEEETAEFDRPDTIDALAEALESLGHTVDRIGHARQLVARLAAGDRWPLVFNIAEGLRGLGREAQIPCLLDVYDIAYTFSDPLVMALSLHKGFTKAVLREAGLAATPFALVETVADCNRVCLPFPLFAKPVAEGTGKGIGPGSILHSKDELHKRCVDLLSRYRQPVLVEPYLAGREFTVGLWGTGPRAEVIGTLEIILRAGAEQGVYSYANKELCEDLVDYPRVSAEDEPLVRPVEALALAAWKTLGCRDAGRVDIRCDAEGKPQFLEVNPLAGLHPQHSDLPMLCAACDISYASLIERIVGSACERVRV